MHKLSLKIATLALAGLVSTAALAQQAPDQSSPWTALDKLALGADGFGMPAGALWSNDQALSPQGCASACNLTWTGGWVTVIEGEMSICAATNGMGMTLLSADGKPGGLEAGPIWNNGEAGEKCKAALESVSWVKENWITYEPGKASACTCVSDAGYHVRAWTPNNITE